VRARRLSAATVSNIKQNRRLAFVYNLLGIPIRREVSFRCPLLPSPNDCERGDEFVSVSVISNARAAGSNFSTLSGCADILGRTDVSVGATASGRAPPLKGRGGNMAA